MLNSFSNSYTLDTLPSKKFIGSDSPDKWKVLDFIKMTGHKVRFFYKINLGCIEPSVIFFYKKYDSFYKINLGGIERCDFL